MSENLRLFRVFPWILGARRGAPGHALHVPTVQGAGRLDNPPHYSVLYASDAATGAVAEAFGNHATWTDRLFEGRAELPGSRTAIAEIDVRDGAILDLDDGGELSARNLRPSRIVTRDRATTQTWALDVFRESAWAGVRWWSHYDSRWGSHGLWALAGLRVIRTTPLDREHAAVTAAASALARLFA